MQQFKAMAWYGVDQQVTQPYDLERQPRDLCLKVRGGNMLGMHGSSDKAVFSKEMIEAALKQIPSP